MIKLIDTAHTVPLSCLRMSKQFPPTPEQIRIIHFKGSRLVVIAFAGTGKTTTLVNYALANPNRRMLYIAFNRSVRDEAMAKFPRNVDCKTSHQIAYAVIGKKYRHKQKQNLTLSDISRELNSKSWGTLKDVLETLKNFLASEDEQVLTGHTPQNEKPQSLSPPELQYKAGLVELANRLWDRMKDIEHPFPMIHDGYLKLYQLSKPNLAIQYSTILFDEAQDANPVTSAIVTSQKCIVILVGDRHQQIYRFRGAENALDNPAMADEPRMYLTNSFRFGPQVAMVANAILTLKDEPHRVIGRGKPDHVLTKLPSGLPHVAVLHRTVLGTIQTAIVAANAGHKVYWVGGAEKKDKKKGQENPRLAELKDAYWLYKGERHLVKNKRLLSEFNNFSQYEQVAKETGNSEMRRTIALIKEPNILEQLQTLIANLVEEEQQAQVTVSTAHNAKGLEWENVALSDDFPDIFAMSDKPEIRDDEINLLYVAVTRAMHRLAINGMVETILRYTLLKRKEAQTKIHATGYL